MDLNVNWAQKSNRKKLKDIKSLFDLIQVIQGRTRITSSSQTQSDPIVSTKAERITNTLHLLARLLDHNMTFGSKEANKTKVHTRK